MSKTSDKWTYDGPKVPRRAKVETQGKPNQPRPEGKEEPVFMLRASDVVAPDMVDMWAARAESVGADPVIVSDARQFAQQMRSWQALYGAELPSMLQDGSIQSAANLVARVTGEEVHRPSSVEETRWAEMSPSEKSAFVNAHGLGFTLRAVEDLDSAQSDA